MTYKKSVANIEGKIIKLRIEQDIDIESPRKEMDGWLGTMVCFHSKYDLGDEQMTDHREWLESLVSELSDLSDDEVVIEKMNERFSKYIPIEHDNGASDIVPEWVIANKDDENDLLFDLYGRLPIFDSKEDALDYLEDMKDEFIDNITEELDDEELLEIIESKTIVLPLFLYDHGGITMSVNSFSCSWDSGQVGWIYCTLDDARKEFRDLDENSLRKKVEEALISEVETYDQYLRGDVWGFVIEEVDENENVLNTIDSCWGFYGDNYDENGMKDHIDEKYHSLLDSL